MYSKIRPLLKEMAQKVLDKMNTEPKQLQFKEAGS